MLGEVTCPNRTGVQGQERTPRELLATLQNLALQHLLCEAALAVHDCAARAWGLFLTAVQWCQCLPLACPSPGTA